MLSTSGLSPVAHEFCLASVVRAFGSECNPVAPEWPITTMELGYACCGARDPDAVDVGTLEFEPESEQPLAATRSAATATLDATRRSRVMSR